MPKRSQDLTPVDAIYEALLERLEMAHDLAVVKSSADTSDERKRWRTLHAAAGEVAALARALEILTRPR
jgi:hypothetical protein